MANASPAKRLIEVAIDLFGQDSPNVVSRAIAEAARAQMSAIP
jgi:hypothetical protein